MAEIGDFVGGAAGVDRVQGVRGAGGWMRCTTKSSPVQVLFLEMRRRRMTYADLAAACGMSFRTLEEWHSGRCAPQVAVLDRALGALGMRLTVARISPGA